MNDMDLLSSFGPASGLLGFFLALFFALLSLLVPFFFWRIGVWTGRCFREMEKTNARLDRLIELAGGALPGEMPAQVAETQAGIGAEDDADRGEVPPAPAEKGDKPAPDPEPEPSHTSGLEPASTPGTEDLFRAPPADTPPPPPGQDVPETGLEPALPTADGERPEAGPGSDEPAVKPPAAGTPGPVPLPADPKRPETRLARCDGCGHKLAYKEILAGKRVKCPACGKVLALP